MSCCNNTKSNQEGMLIVNKAREAAACAEANCGSSFTNATNAATSATNAAASAAAAAASETNVENLWEDFQERYMGPYATPPVAISEGSLYYNTTSNVLFVWNGSAWVSADFNEFTNFTATGTTTARNLVTRTSEYVNVKDFGAVGDGIADDRAAFIAAASAAITSSKQLVIPSGNYFISGSLILANGLYAICYGDITGPSVFVENGCCFYGDNCYFYKQSDYQDILHFSNWNVDASSRAQHTTLGLAQRYDGQANINSYFGSGNPLHCYLHYGEGRKNAGQKASGTAGALAGQVNVFSLDNGTGVGRSEIQGLAGAVTVVPDALLGNSGNFYNEFSINGPSNDTYREAYMAGATFLVQKYCPTRTIDSTHEGSYGITITTRPGGGGFDVDRPNKTNYTLNAGIAVNGWTGPITATTGTHIDAQIAHDYGILIGGSGSCWIPSTARSKIGTGIGITDYVSYAIDLFTKHPNANPNSGAIRVNADAGFCLFGLTSPIETEAKIQIGGLNSQFGNSIRIAESSHATSNRAGIQLGNWVFAQDGLGNGTKDFTIFDGLTNRMIFAAAGATNIITLPNLPTSATGLTTGQLWRDAASGNVVKIVP